MDSEIRAKKQPPRIDFHKALCEGAAEAGVENAALDGYPQKFFKPGEHVALPRLKPVVRVSMTAEDFLKAATAQKSR